MSFGAPELVTTYAPLRAVLALAARAARTDALVSITGARGTGKTLLARTIHAASPRAHAAFTTIDAAACANDALDAALARAGDGTLYIANVDALDARGQGVLRHHRTGVRVIVSSRRGLERAATRGLFRGDLLQALSAARFTLPPLRERAVDIPVLARHFLALAARDGAPPSLPPDTIDRWQRCRWPGNVAELRRVVERTVQ